MLDTPGMIIILSIARGTPPVGMNRSPVVGLHRIGTAEVPRREGDGVSESAKCSEGASEQGF